MARAGRTPRCRVGVPPTAGTLRVMPEPRPSRALRLVGVVVVIALAWVLLWPVLSIVRSIVAFVLYVVVAVVAYQVGKIVGRASDDGP